MPVILIIIRWAKTIQVVGRTPVLSIHQIPDNPADRVAAYQDLLLFSPTTSPNQSLLTFTTGKRLTTVTVKMLSQALIIMLQALRLDSSLYTLHSLRRGPWLPTGMGSSRWI